MIGGIRLQLLAVYRWHYGVMTTVLFGLVAMVPIGAAAATGGHAHPAGIVLAVLDGIHRGSALPVVIRWTALAGLALFLVSRVAEEPAAHATTLILPRMRSRVRWWASRVTAITMLTGVYTAWLVAVTLGVSRVLTRSATSIGGHHSLLLAAGQFWGGLLTMGLAMTVVRAWLRAPLMVYWGGMVANYVTAELYVQGLLGRLWTPLAYPSVATVTARSAPLGWPWTVEVAVFLVGNLVWLVIDGFQDVN